MSLAVRLFGICCVFSFAPLHARTSPVVAAASDLQFALEEVAEAFERETGDRLRLSFGSTGNFSRQIREGAPFELFLAADEQFVLDLAEDGFTRDRGTLYALGRVALMAPHGSTLEVDECLNGLSAALETGELRRFAIANPEHAPYGMRAREALQHRGLWEQLQSVMVLGENVSQAAQFALSGSTQGGIIAWSLALAPAISPRGDYTLIPEDWHTPLRQRMALLEGAGPVAEEFYDFIQSPAAREIMKRYGFTAPSE
ncbi:MAG: molybdate ABC transporter substrate-binding protein [Pseudohongiellaceae bacterium]